MLKDLLVTLDTDDALEAQFVIAYYGSSDPSKMLKNCLMAGYLVASGKLSVTESEATDGEQGSEPAQEAPRKAVGNALFGIKGS